MIRLSIFGVEFLTDTLPEILVEPFLPHWDRETKEHRAIIITKFDGRNSRCFYGTFRFSDNANMILDKYKLIRLIALVLQ